MQAEKLAWAEAVEKDVTSVWCPPVNLLHIFRTLLPKNPSGVLLSQEDSWKSIWEYMNKGSTGSVCLPQILYSFIYSNQTYLWLFIWWLTKAIVEMKPENWTKAEIGLAVQSWLGVWDEITVSYPVGYQIQTEFSGPGFKSHAD